MTGEMKMKQKFHIDKTWKGFYEEDIHFEGSIELDDKVIANVDDSWRKLYFDFNTQQVAEHIAFNMIVNDLTLSRIDGFANLSDDLVSLL
jgi:hypothetical protein